MISESHSRRPFLSRALRRVAATVGYRLVWLSELPESATSVHPRADAQIRRWYADPKTERLKWDFPLSPESLAWDVGGYSGEWAATMTCRHNCAVEIFEPVPQYIETLKWRFCHHPKVHVNDFGLGARNEDVPFVLAGPRSSAVAVQTGQRTVRSRIRDIVELLHEADCRPPDVLKLNIEGGEFPLLEHLIASRAVENLGYLLIQFHETVPGAPERRATIQERLSETHSLMWDYPFLWEAWEPRPSRSLPPPGEAPTSPRPIRPHQQPAR